MPQVLPHQTRKDNSNDTNSRKKGKYLQDEEPNLDILKEDENNGDQKVKSLGERRQQQGWKWKRGR